MKVWAGNTQLPSNLVATATQQLGLEIDNGRYEGRAYAFKLTPKSSRDKYARTAPSGRKLKATCYHGFRDFIRLCFELGAVRVQVTRNVKGDWRSKEEFRRDLHRLANLNVGSYMQPASMIELCECDDKDEWL